MSETVVCIGAVVKSGPRVLLVRQAAGHSLAGQWTIPWGRLDQGESPTAAAVREVLEESHVVAEVEGLLGMQELPAPWEGWVALIFQCSHASGDPRPDGHETDAARYFSASEFEALTEPTEPWSAWLVRRVFAGKAIPKIHVDEANPFVGHPSFL